MRNCRISKKSSKIAPFSVKKVLKSHHFSNFMENLARIREVNQEIGQFRTFTPWFCRGNVVPAPFVLEVGRTTFSLGHLLYSQNALFYPWHVAVHGPHWPWGGVGGRGGGRDHLPRGVREDHIYLQNTLKHYILKVKSGHFGPKSDCFWSKKWSFWPKKWLFFDQKSGQLNAKM